MGILILGLNATTIFIIAGLGELFSQKSGVMNVGIEGVMSLAGLAAFIVAQTTGSVWIGMTVGVFAGGFMGLIHAFFSISLRLSQILSGLGIWLFGIGFTSYYGRSFTGQLTAPQIKTVFGLSPIFCLGIGLIIFFQFLLNKTHFGMKVRAVGEVPSVADAWGCSVRKIRYLCIVVGSAMIGLSGAYLTIIYSQLWAAGVIAGRGWISLALVFSSLWTPVLLLGSSLFMGILWVFMFSAQMLPGAPTFLMQMIPYSVAILSVVAYSLIKARGKTFMPSALGEPYHPED
jgi:simple sugar transport system permease protein